MFYCRLPFDLVAKLFIDQRLRKLSRLAFPVLQLTMGEIYHVKVEVSMAVTMRNGVFWDVMSCGSCKNLRLGGT
jgi:hypothetical protein